MNGLYSYLGWFCNTEEGSDIKLSILVVDAELIADEQVTLG